MNSGHKGFWHNIGLSNSTRQLYSDFVWGLLIVVVLLVGPRGMHLLWKCSEACFVFLLSCVTLQCLSLSSLCPKLLGFVICFSLLLFFSYNSNMLHSLPLLVSVISSLPFFISKELVFSRMVAIHSVNVC